MATVRIDALPSAAAAAGHELPAMLSGVTNRVTAGSLTALGLASPAFTGTPTAPTPTAGTNNTTIATTAFVGAAVTAAAVPAPATVAPLIDGVAAVGTTTKYAREDHKHPTDTTRAASVHTHVQADVTDWVATMAAANAFTHPRGLTITEGAYGTDGSPTFGGFLNVKLPTANDVNRSWSMGMGSDGVFWYRNHHTTSWDAATGINVGDTNLTDDWSRWFQVWSEANFDPTTKAPRPQLAAGVGQWLNVATASGGAWILPAGGTWAWAGFYVNAGGGTIAGNGSGIAAGGTTLDAGTAGYAWMGFQWRIA